MKEISQYLPPVVSLIGIDGRGGAGKTTLANNLAKDIRAQVVHLDDFYLPEIKDPPTFCEFFDHARVIEQVLAPIKNKEETSYQVYDWDQGQLAGWIKLSPHAPVILEGITACAPALAKYLDWKIWVETDKDIAKARGLARSGLEENEMWDLQWVPAEDRYIDKYDPLRHADMIVDNN